MKWVKDLLQRQYRPLITAAQSLPLDKALQIMMSHNIHHLPVVETVFPAGEKQPETPEEVTTKHEYTGEPIPGELIGIVSDRDIRLATTSPFHFIESKKKKYTKEQQVEELLQNLHKHSCGEIMTRGVVTVSDDAPIVEAVKLMRVANVGAIPVVKSGTKQIVGVLTRTDMLDHLIRLIEPVESAESEQ